MQINILVICNIITRSGTILKNYPDIRIVRVYGTIIEEKMFSGLNEILSLAKRKVDFRNDEDFSTVPEVLEEYSLHVKIRNETSKLTEVKEFIIYENELLSEEGPRNYKKKIM